MTGTYSQSTNLTFTITQNPSHGALSNFSAPNCVFTTFMTCTETVKYTPAADFNGLDSFKFKASASALDSEEADVNITVNSVNDAPSFLISANDTVNEDAGPQVVANFANTIFPGPADESGQTVQFIVNTHYHRDHQGGNSVVGPSAVVISTDYTRDRTLAVIQSSPAAERSLFRPAGLTFHEKLTIYLEPYSAEVYFPGKAHTSGDALVYFPEQRAIAMGDLFLNRSSPAMDDGSTESWIRALDQVLARPLAAVVPGHFELGTKVELQTFRDYLNDLFTQVRALYEKRATLEEVRRSIRVEKYRDFRQYPQFHATFADNAETIYQQLQQR